ncbi:MAG: Gfo/Idh/MocA family oxidoreductase [Sphingobium sp.]
MATKSIRVGIISANWGAHAHLPAWRSLEGVEVTAICTSRPETAAAAARDFAIERPFHDFRAMAADPDLDIIDCGTRPPLRYQMVMAALDGGKHVYNGIPFAPDLAAARDMAELRARTGLVGAVDAFMQAVPQLSLMKQMIDEGAIGALQGVRISMDQPLFTHSLVNVPGYAWFADAANGASIMRNIGSHLLHLLVHLFGPIESVVADLSVQAKRWTMPDGSTVTPQVPDKAALLIRFESGLTAQLGACWSMPDGDGFRLEAWGGDGRMVATAPGFPQAHDTRLFIGSIAELGLRTGQEVALPEDRKTVPGSSAHADSGRGGLFPMAAIFASLLREIEGGGKAAPDFAQAVHVQQVVEAADLSSDERRWVRVADL